MLILSCAAASAAMNMLGLGLVLSDTRSMFYIVQGAATPFLLDSLSGSLPAVIINNRMTSYPIVAASVTYALYQTMGKSM